MSPYAIGVLVISLVVAFLAVARLSRLVTEDSLLIGLRRRVVKRWGAESKATYLVHCPWCMSIWISALVMPIAVIFPNVWVIAALSVPAASMVAGLLLDRGE